MDSRADIERIYRERFASYVGATSGIVGSRDAARDVVQDGFARALAHHSRFRGGSLEAWIWRIVLNRARDVRRRPQPAVLRDDIAALEVDGGSLVAAVLGLPDRRRTVVLLRYVAGLQNTEIAEALGITAGTVAATLSQAREQLGILLEHEEVRG